MAGRSALSLAASRFPGIPHSLQFGFWRETNREKALVILNADSEPFQISNLKIPDQTNSLNQFDPKMKISLENQYISTEIPPNWMTIIVFES